MNAVPVIDLGEKKLTLQKLVASPEARRKTLPAVVRVLATRVSMPPRSNVLLLSETNKAIWGQISASRGQDLPATRERNRRFEERLTLQDGRTIALVTNLRNEPHHL